jgi:hypothetical protein
MQAAKRHRVDTDDRRGAGALALGGFLSGSGVPAPVPGQRPEGEPPLEQPASQSRRGRAQAAMTPHWVMALVADARGGTSRQGGGGVGKLRFETRIAGRRWRSGSAAPVIRRRGVAARANGRGWRGAPARLWAIHPVPGRSAARSARRRLLNRPVSRCVASRRGSRETRGGRLSRDRRGIRW